MLPPNLLAVLSSDHAPVSEFFKSLTIAFGLRKWVFGMLSFWRWRVQNRAYVSAKLQTLVEYISGCAYIKTRPSRTLYHVVRVRNRRYSIAYGGFICHCLSPPQLDPSVVGKAQTMMQALEGFFSMKFWHQHMKKDRLWGIVQCICTWAHNTMKWYALCSHSAFNESFPLDTISLSSAEMVEWWHAEKESKQKIKDKRL